MGRAFHTSDRLREFKTVRFVVGGFNQQIKPGVHIGRRIDAPRDSGWEVILVDIIEDRETFFTFVFRFGQSDPEPWQDWEIRLYLTGMETITQEALSLPAIEEASLALH